MGENTGESTGARDGMRLGVSVGSVPQRIGVAAISWVEWEALLNVRGDDQRFAHAFISGGYSRKKDPARFCPFSFAGRGSGTGVGTLHYHRLYFGEH